LPCLACLPCLALLALLASSCLACTPTCTCNEHLPTRQPSASSCLHPHMHTHCSLRALLLARIHAAAVCRFCFAYA
jgi:hypothetical protein